MKNRDGLRRYRIFTFLLTLIVATLATAGCSNPEKAKAEHLSRGEAFLKEKKYQEASIEFRNAIQIDGGLAAAHWGLAQAYEGLGRFQEVFEELKQVTILDASNLDARVKLGNYVLLSGGPKPSPEIFAEAERLASEVLQTDPKHIGGHTLLASIRFAQGRRDDAFAELNKAIELDPNRAESYISLALFHLQMKDTAKAEEALKRAVSVNDNLAMAHIEYGKFLLGMNRVGEAEAQLRRAAEVEPENRDARLILARFYLASKQNDKAEQAFKALAELDKDKPDGRADLAEFYAFIGRQDDAINIYQDIANKSPEYTRARYRLGEIMLQRGNIDGALAQVKAVTDTNPRDMQALLLRARIYLQTNEPKKAIEDLKEVLDQQPNDPTALYYMAEANYRAGLNDQARTFAGDLERYYPDKPSAVLPAKLMQVQINLAAGDRTAALRLANEIIDSLEKPETAAQIPPQFLAELRTKALLARGTAQLASGNTKAAQQDLEAVRERMPNAPSSYITLASVALRENKPDAAIDFYDRALALDSTNFEALSGVLNVYIAQKRFDQAHMRIDKALSAQPNKAPLHFLKAQVYGFERNAEGAEAELRRAIELDGSYLPAYSALGALFVNLNQKDRAIAEYRKIIERKPDNAAAYTLIGMLEDSRQNYDAAVENYRKAVEIDQNAAIAANNLAWLYAARGKGNLDEAVRLAQGVVQKYPEIAGFADTLGWVYYKKELHGAAIEQLQKAVAKDGDNPLYHYHLGLALAGNQDRLAARRAIEQALRLGEKRNFAEAEEARRALASL